MPRYQIKVHSCRKDTNVEMELNHIEANVLKRLARKTQEASQSECEPTIFVSRITTLKAAKKEPGKR
jgi:hypothetical protein